MCQVKHVKNNGVAPFDARFPATTMAGAEIPPVWRRTPNLTGPILKYTPSLLAAHACTHTRPLSSLRHHPYRRHTLGAH